MVSLKAFKYTRVTKLHDWLRSSKAYASIVARPGNRGELLQYWKRPGVENAPAGYAGPSARSLFLLDLLRRHVPLTEPILEVGCNVGRNLHYLYTGGYHDLTGIEVNTDALEELRKRYPDSAARARLLNGAIEEIAPTLRPGQFGCVFSMAVLEHIHPDSEWTFPMIASSSKLALITVENEVVWSQRSFPRKYRPIFESCGFVQSEERRCDEGTGLQPRYMARVFVRK